MYKNVEGDKGPIKGGHFGPNLHSTFELCPVQVTFCLVQDSRIRKFDPNSTADFPSPTRTMSTFTKAAPSSPEIPMDTDEPGPSRRSIFTPVRPVSSNEGSSPDCNTSSPSSSNDSPQDPHRQGSSSGRSGSPTQKWHFNPLFYYFSSGEGETPTFDTSTSQVQGLTRDGKVRVSCSLEGNFGNSFYMQICCPGISGDENHAQGRDRRPSSG